MTRSSLPRSDSCWLAGVCLALTVLGCSRSVPPNPASIVLITIDTVRADHLSTYGYFRPTTPTLDHLANQALVFERAFTTMATTLPAHASLMTSTRTTTHGLKGNFQHLGRALEADGGLRTLAEMLADLGYRTAAFVSAAPVRDHTGLQLGFQTFDQPLEKERRADATVDRVLAWLAGVESGPFLLWVHLFDPHRPRQPPPPFDRAFEDDDELIEFLRERSVPRPERRFILDQNNAYDGEILFTDSQISRLFAALEDRQEWDDLAVVVTGDHGEGLGQHGWMDHGRIYNEQLLVPLIIKLPAGRGPRGARPQTVASLIDVVPTLVAALDLPIAAADRAQLEGIDLLTADESRPGVLSEQTHRGVLQEPGLRYSLTNRSWKYFYRTEAEDELYDMTRDPFETENVIERQPRVALQMRRQIEAILDASAESRRPSAVSELDDQIVEQLRALGYVGGPAGTDEASHWRGTAIWGHEVREFRPCGGDEAWWVVDGTGDLRRLLHERVSEAEPYPEAYVEFTGEIEPAAEGGFAADYLGVIRVVEVLSAGREGAGCDDS